MLTGLNSTRTGNQNRVRELLSRAAKPLVLLTFVVALSGLASLAYQQLGTSSTRIAYAFNPPVQTVPYKVNFQARLTDQNGNIMPDGSYNVKFRLFTNSAGTGSPVWEEDYLVANSQGVSLANGLFSVQLGSITALTPQLFSSNPNLWLQIELPSPATATSSSPSWTEGPMSPLQPLESAPYAMNADTLDGIDSTQFARTDQGNTFSGNNTFSNNVTIVGASTLQGNATIGSTTSAGALSFLDGTTDGFNGKLQVTTLTGNQTYTLPNATGTICVSSGNCVGGGGAGSAIGGSGTANTLAMFTATGTIGNSILTQQGTASLTDSGNLIVQGTGSSSIAGSLGIGTTTPGANLDVQSGATTSNAVNITANSLTSGSALNISVAPVSGSSNTLNVSQTGTVTGTDVSTGSSLNISRNLTSNASGSAPAITLDSTVAAGNALTWSHTVANQPNRILIVVCSGASSNPTGVTYDGIAMTQLGIESQSGESVSIWKLIAPPVGTYTVAVSGPTTCYDASSSSWYNVDQITGVGSFVSANGSSVTIPTASGQVVIDAAMGSGSTGSSPGSGQTKIEGGGSSQGGSSYKAASGSSTSMSWSGFDTPVVETAVNLLPFPPPGVHLHGALENLSSNCTVVAGVCEDVSNILNLNQQYSGATGTVLNIQNAGTGDLLDLANGSGTILGGFNNSGQLFYKSGSYTVTLATATQANNVTISIPADTHTTDTICLLTLNNCASSPGVQTIGALDGGTANGNGATISGSTLYLQSASASFPGLVNTGTQTFAGNKTFSGTTTINNTTVAAGMSITITGGNTLSRPASPTEGMLYYDTTTHSLLVYSNGKWQADRTTATKIVAMGSATGCTGSSPVASSNPDAADFVSTSCTSSQTTINAAISALPAGGGTVYLEEGTYILSGTVTVPANVILMGAGEATILKYEDNYNTSGTMITISGAHASIANLRLDGNQSNNSNTQDGITNGGSNSLTLRNIDVENFRREGYRDTGSSYATITNSTFASNLGDGLYLQSTSNVTITANTIYSNGGNGINGLNLTGGTISGNNISSNTSDGILTNGGGGNTISGNTISGNGSKGIELQNTASPSTVSGNTIVSNALGIYLHTANYVTVTGNNIGSNSGDGIDVGANIAADSSYNTIDGNNIYNNGGSGSGDGIEVGGISGSTANNISGNNITDTAGTGYAIQLTSHAVNTYLSGNTYSGTGASTISDAGTGTIYANQQDASGNLINKSQGGGFTIGASSATASLTLQGGIVNSQLPVPTLSSTVTNVGTAGTTTYRYQITALDGTGETTGSTIQQTTTGNATLSGTNYNTITWTAVPGAVQYNIYRCTGTGCTPAKLATVAGNVTTYNDQAAGSPSGTAPATNTTGGGTFAGVLQGSALLSNSLDTPSAGTLNIGTSNATAITIGSATTTTTVQGNLIADQNVLINGTYTTTNNYRQYISGTLNSSVTTSQYGFQNQVNFNPSGASLTNIYGTTSTPVVSGSSLNISSVYAFTGSVQTAAGYTGQITNGAVYNASDATISGSQLFSSFSEFQGGAISANSGNTSGTINDYNVKLNGSTAAAGSGGTLNNYGIYLTQPSGSGAGTTNNYGLYIQGNGAGSTNYSIYNNSTALSYYAGSINAVGGYQYNGTAGLTTTCSGGQFLQNQKVQGGITTLGTCASAAAGLTGSGTVGTIAMFSGSTTNLASSILSQSGTTISVAGSLSATGTITTSATAGNALAVTGAPTNSATSSLIQIGSAIQGGNSATNGGTYLGLNAPSSGAGSAADFLNFQTNGITSFKLDNAGDLTLGPATTSGSTSTSSSLTFNNYVQTNGLVHTTLKPTSSGNGAQLQVVDTLGNTQLIFGESSGTSNFGYISAPMTGQLGIGQSGDKLAVGLGPSGLPNYTLDVGGDINTSGYYRQAGSIVIDTKTGTQNTYVGVTGISTSSSGGGNTATGLDALEAITSGNDNVAVGIMAANGNTTGSNNVAVGGLALQSNTTGSKNTAIGYEAGTTDVQGHFSTGATLQNAAAIGAYAQVQKNNTIVLGSVDNATQVVVGATVPVGTNSFGVSPVDLNSTSITASQSNGSGTITASAAIFSASNVGEELVWADGTTETITGYTSSTVVTGSSTTITESSSYFRTQRVGFQVTNTGNAYVQNTSTSTFQVQNASGAAILNVDTTNGIITIGSGANTITLSTSGGYTATGTAQHVKTIMLAPEYAGAVLDAQSDSSCTSANNGTMTSAYDSTNRMNYYNWTSSQTSAQCYDVVVQIPIPSDFASWNGVPDVEMRTNGTGTAAWAVMPYDTTGAADSSTSGTLTTTTWANEGSSALDGTYTAGGYMTIKIRMSSTSGAAVELGNITLKYNSKF